MANLRRLRSLTSSLSAGATSGALALAMTFVLTVVASPAAQAQTFRVLYNFTCGDDGCYPNGITIDRTGRLYGTTGLGGLGGLGHGTVYRLMRHDSNWLFGLLYSFTGGSDGSPAARVVFGPNGLLYGTTTQGGDLACNGGYGCGTVFDLRPGPTRCESVLCPWTKTVLYGFRGGSDGKYTSGDVVFDQAGNI